MHRSHQPIHAPHQTTCFWGKTKFTEGTDALEILAVSCCLAFVAAPCVPARGSNLGGYVGNQLLLPAVLLEFSRVRWVESRSRAHEAPWGSLTCEG